MDSTTYELREWVDTDKLNWKELSQNPNAIQLLSKNIDKVDWEFLIRKSNSIFTTFKIGIIRDFKFVTLKLDTDPIRGYTQIGIGLNNK